MTVIFIMLSTLLQYCIVIVMQTKLIVVVVVVVVAVVVNLPPTPQTPNAHPTEPTGLLTFGIFNLYTKSFRFCEEYGVQSFYLKFSSYKFCEINIKIEHLYYSWFLHITLSFFV